MRRLRINYEINILALVAFLASVLNFGLLVYQYLRGPQIVMRIGERVNIIVVEHPAKPNNKVILINGRLTFTNTGSIGRDAILVNERIVIQLDDESRYEYRWLNFENYVRDASGSGAPVPIFQDSAHEIVIAGGNSSSHQVTFSAFPESRSLEKNTSTDFLSKRGLQFYKEGHGNMSINFIAETTDAGSEGLQKSCDIAITSSVWLDIETTGWATVICQ